MFPVNTILAWIINIYHDIRKCNNNFIIASREYFLHIMNLNLLWCYFSTNSWLDRSERIASCYFSTNSRIDWSERIALRWFRTLQTIPSYVIRWIGTLEWFFVACWGIVIWSSYVIIVERTCTSESMNPRPCFLALQYRLCSLLSLVTLLFF